MMQEGSVRQAPALFIGAPASGAGKTTVTAALARWHRIRGRRVRVFKTGPDFLDPMILERASGNPVYQLDLWMGGASHCRQLLHAAAGAADLILIEGVMGLFDGNPSSADLAREFGIPILAVIDASAMAQTFGAVAHGLSSYRRDLTFAGVLANRVGSAAHAGMLAEGMPAGLRFLGGLARDAGLALAARHLGLVQAEEIADIESRLERAAAALARTAIAELPQAVAFAPEAAALPPRLLGGCRIAVARDPAFSFIYRANLDLLRAMGAELVFFSPLTDAALPEADSLYLPGGYPELHLERLSANAGMQAAIRAHHAQGKPVVAECGGMLYLLESLTDAHGRRAPMAGVLPGHAVMQTRLANLGMQEMRLPEGRLRGHSFHHTHMETGLVPFTQASDARAQGRGEAVYRAGRLHASYVHAYFPSGPEAAARLFRP
ncbi:MAG TPA: cobyrinate a,c-diamide synthase [Acidiferrobacterales bacterium]|nr:cobyrinate a,c-diamide synthase [Acidiferrobacterales bacterium]